MVTLTSVAAKPETGSLNWKYTVKALEPTGAVAGLVIVRTGAVESAAIVKEAAPLELLMLSAAAPSATVTVTLPPAVGVTSPSHRFRPEVWMKLASVPLVTETSAAAKPVTGSLNWK